MGLNLYLKFSRESFFTEWLMIALCITAIATSFTAKDLKTDAKIVIIYCLASLAQVAISDFAFISIEDFDRYKQLTVITIYAFVIVETILLSLLILKRINAKQPKKISKFMLPAFTAYGVLNVIIKYPIKKVDSIFYIFELFILMLLGLSFLLELFKRPLEYRRQNQSDFWIVLGIIILIGTITPFFVIKNYLDNNYSEYTERLYIINNSAYSILFFIFIMTAKWNKTQRK